MSREHADFIIKKQLRSGPKTSKELKEACEKRGFSPSTFYYHMKQLVDKLKEVQKIRVKNSQGRTVVKYSLVKEEKVTFWSKSSGIRGFSVDNIEVEVPSNRRVLELASWIRREPRGWPRDNFEVKVARLYFQHSGYLVPDIVRAPEDPDAYAFRWSDEELERLGLDELMRLGLYGSTRSRFFDLKLVYDAIVADSNKVLNKGPVFVGAHNAPMVVDYTGIYGEGMQPLRYVGRPIGYEPIEELGSVCVAVREEADSEIWVVHVENRWGKLDKAWVRGLAKQLSAKKLRIIEFKSLKENVRRVLLMNLRDVLKRRKLLIPKRYVKLIEELLDYSYKKPSSAYVSALAIAVDLCLKT